MYFNMKGAAQIEDTYFFFKITSNGLGVWVNITTGSMSIILRSSWTDLKWYLCIRAAKNKNNSDSANDRPKQSRLPEKRKLHWFVGQVVNVIIR